MCMCMCTFCVPFSSAILLSIVRSHRNHVQHGEIRKRSTLAASGSGASCVLISFIDSTISGNRINLLASG
uniref:Putative secreted protein n=1 Tax=Anopheles darlingi TaxID=43151 RepID=A0A2M4D9K4_ANODA